jgi:hypothetical protein
VPGCTDRHDEPAEPDEWAIAYREEA